MRVMCIPYGNWYSYNKKTIFQSRVNRNVLRINHTLCTRIFLRVLGWSSTRRVDNITVFSVLIIKRMTRMRDLHNNI